MGGFFSGELLQAADSGRGYTPRQSDGIEESKADVRTDEAERYRCVADRNVPAESYRTEAPRAPEGGRGRTRALEANNRSSGVPCSPEDLQRCRQEETLSRQPVRRGGVSGRLKGLFRPHYMNWSEQMKV